MSDDSYDVIVIGAGLAGLACAGELVLGGARPLLVCETKEVASNIRSTYLGGTNRAMAQLPTWNMAWGGGWWFNLARQLNVPIQYHPEPGLALTVWSGTPGEIHQVPRCGSASALTQVLAKFSPWPIDDVREEFEQLMSAGLSIPYEELVRMHDIPVGQWLDDQRATDMGAYVALTMLAQLTMVDVPTARDKVSVYGAFGFLRTYLCGEGVLPAVFPDNREGLAIPIADEIERRGGKVMRRAKVQSVSTEGGVAGHVLLVDGTELSAPVVAIAAGNRRVRALLDELPPEVDRALQSSIDIVDFYTYTLLEKPVGSTVPAFMGVLGPDGANIAWTWPMHAVAPWTVEPGYQVIVATSAASPDKLADLGGEEGVYARLNDVHEGYFPGYNAAIVEQKRSGHNHLWYDQISAGPKLTRTIESVKNLWFVGEGSTPIVGVGFEAACSAGILGARAILAARAVLAGGR